MQTSSMKMLETARKAGGQRIKGINSSLKSKSTNQESIFERIMAKYQPKDARSFIQSAHIIDPVTQNKYTIAMLKRAQFLTQFNGFYLPSATIVAETEKCDQDSMKAYMFSSEELNKGSRSLKKMEETFKKDLKKADLKNYKMKFNNVTVEFQLEKEIWYQANAEIYQTPNGGYLIYGKLITKWKSTPQEQENTTNLNEIMKTLELNQPTEEDQDPDQIPNLVENESKLDKEETTLSNNDVALIVQQTKCTREDAIESLKKNNNDLINAIMELTEI
jgi:NACalpha-BTF3-like transcription factor